MNGRPWADSRPNTDLTTAPLDAAAIDRRVIEEAVWSAPTSPASDFDLNPQGRSLVPPNRRLRPAAVLCALAPREGAFQVILTLRSSQLKTHAGQVAFPGGKIDPTDPSPMAAALREAEEEIGLTSDQVEILGPIDRYETGTGFTITPFIGICSPAFRPIAEEGEVAEVFETPLDFLMDARNRERRSVEFQGAMRHYYAYDWQDKLIWGATAGMLKALNDRIDRVRG